MENDSPSSLSAEQKLEVATYVSSLIKGWLAWLGVANLAVLIGAIVYIFFILPGKAVTEATNRVESDISRITKNLSEQVEANLVKFGQAQERFETLNRELKDTSKQFKFIKADIAEIQQGNVGEAANFLHALKEAPEVSQIIQRISQLEQKSNRFVITAGGSGPINLSNSNRWSPFPELQADIELKSKSLVIAFYEVVMHGSSSHLVTRLMIDQKEQTRTRSITGNAAYWSPNSVWIGELEKGKHSFTVDYRTPVGGTNAPQEDWQTRVLTVAVIGE